jgi:iron complex outermembrane receptor protein
MGPASAQTTEQVLIVGRGVARLSVAGFGAAPLPEAPLQGNSFSSAQRLDAGVSSLGGLTRLDASLGDAYNAEGYWSIISSRGYTLDNRTNYRREGLPINAETAIGLDNKDRIELLKGASGIQAGTSAPGGLINLVVKRPTADPLRVARLEVQQSGARLAAVDLADRIGPQSALGWRLNAAAERLEPTQRHSVGQRHLIALATEWRAGPDTLLEAELESSHQSQPSVVGFSMLGPNVPAAASVDPRINLNDQPWTQPVVLDGQTASLRLQHRLNPDWTLSLQAQQQRLRSDDRTAFPYGVYDDPQNYGCSTWCDRFAPDGRFTYWEFISDNERRTTTSISAALQGKVDTGTAAHRLEAGMLDSRLKARFQEQVFDIAGIGRVDDSLRSPASARNSSPNTDRDEHTTELFLRDAIQLTEQWQAWAGLRATRLTRRSELTSPSPADGSTDPTGYAATLTSPWLAVAWRMTPEAQIYFSTGHGVETEVAPNRGEYTNAGQALPTLKSRQTEAGLKLTSSGLEASLAVFDIDRPQSADIGACSSALPGSCTRAIDGSDHHRGLEASGTVQLASWTWQASAMWLRAQRQGSSVDSINGSRPVNVPVATLRLGTEYRPARLPGWVAAAHLTAESDRLLLPTDPGVRVPGWARLDLGLRHRHTLGQTSLLWRVGIDNVTDRRAWKESPYQFSHVYLYPLAPRTARASVEVGF